MEGERCETCRFWTAAQGSPAGLYPRLGECRRGLRHVNLPASLDDESAGYFGWVWPDHDAGDWCGEYQPRKPLPRVPGVLARPPFAAFVARLPTYLRNVMETKGVTSWEELLTPEQNPEYWLGCGSVGRLKLLDAMRAVGVEPPYHWSWVDMRPRS